jgi:hypothetical protein
MVEYDCDMYFPGYSIDIASIVDASVNDAKTLMKNE